MKTLEMARATAPLSEYAEHIDEEIRGRFGDGRFGDAHGSFLSSGNRGQEFMGRSWNLPDPQGQTRMS
jgi:hypothetical protein